MQPPNRQSIPGPAGSAIASRAWPSRSRPPASVSGSAPERQPEVVVRPEEAAGDDRRLVALPQPLAERLHVAAGASRGKAIIPPSTGAQARSGRAARKAFTPSVFASRMRRARAATRSSRSSATTLRRSAGCAGIDAEEVVEPPHPPREVGLGDDPAAAQARQAVGLGQARRDDELAARGARPSPTAGRAPRGLEVHLVHQHAGAQPSARRRPTARRSSGGVKALEGLWRFVRTTSRVRGRERPLDLARVEPEARLRAPREAAHVEPQPARRVRRAASRSAPRSAPRRRARRPPPARAGWPSRCRSRARSGRDRPRPCAPGAPAAAGSRRPLGR